MQLPSIVFPASRFLLQSQEASRSIRGVKRGGMSAPQQGAHWNNFPAALCLQNLICIEELQELWMIVALKEISKSAREGRVQHTSLTLQRVDSRQTQSVRTINLQILRGGDRGLRSSNDLHWKCQ